MQPHPFKELARCEIFKTFVPWGLNRSPIVDVDASPLVPLPISASRVLVPDYPGPVRASSGKLYEAAVAWFDRATSSWENVAALVGRGRIRRSQDVGDGDGMTRNRPRAVDVGRPHNASDFFLVANAAGDGWDQAAGDLLTRIHPRRAMLWASDPVASFEERFAQPAHFGEMMMGFEDFTA